MPKPSPQPGSKKTPGKPGRPRTLPARKPNAKPLGISKSEFARRDGCSASHVGRAVDQGTIAELADGTMDPALVGTGWRAANRKKIRLAEGAKAAAPLAPDEPGTGGELPDAEGITTQLTRVEAERLKITYDVLKRKREHDIEIGKVVLVEDVAKMLGPKLASVRSKMLAIPNGHAPQVHALKTVMEVQDYLLTVLTEALQELTDG